MKKRIILLLILLLSFPLFFISEVKADDLLDGFVKNGNYAERVIELSTTGIIAPVELDAPSNVEYKINTNSYKKLDTGILSIAFVNMPSLNTSRMVFYKNKEKDPFKTIDYKSGDVLTVRYYIVPENTNDSWTSYQHLPYTVENKKIDVELYKQGNTYILDFDIPELNNSTLIVNQLPHVNINNFKRQDDEIYRMQYFTDYNNDRILFYEFEDEAEIKNQVDEGFNGFRPFVYYNIDTSEVEGVDSLFLPGVTHQNGDNAYIDVLFPMQLDDLLEITINYQYRNRYGALGFGMWWGNWTEKEVVRIKDAEEAKLKWWESLLKATVDPGNFTAVGGWIDLYKNDRGKAEHIENINRLANNSYKNDYIKKINKEIKELEIDHDLVDTSIFGEDNSLYRIYMDNHYRFGATKYEIKDTAIMNVKYIYKGEYYSVYEDDIVSIITKLKGKSQAENFLETLMEIFTWLGENTGTLITVGLVFIALILISPVISIITIIFKSVSFAVKTLFKIPKKILNGLKILFIPKNKRNKNERKWK